MIVQLLQTPRKQLLLNFECFYFQDWLDNQAERRVQGSLNNRKIETLIGAVNQIRSLWFPFFFKLSRWAKFIFWPELDPKAPNLPKFHISRTTGRRKLVDPSNWPQDLIYYWSFQICIPLWQSKVHSKCHFVFCRT